MLLFLSAVVLCCFCGFASLLVNRNGRAANVIGACGPLLGAPLGLIPAGSVLATGGSEAVWHAWNVPYGSFSVQIDALSAFFLLPTLFLSALAALYGVQYMKDKRPGAFWFFFNLLAASMAMLVTARNGVLFLVLWEVMSLSSFFLVTFENEDEAVRRAGWTYLVATHLGTAFLFVLFLMLGHQAGGATLDFDNFSAMRANIAPIADVAFLLAVVGFGTKAGFMPFHVWLPEAHPAAPSHVSALMSGVMIKTGIYGLLRVMTFLGSPAPWWGWLLLTIGLVSGILGVLFALAQHDLKRLLAFSSVENIGIIAIGLGLGTLGLAANVPALAVLGFAGGLLHTINHAAFKGLLFLGAGAVAHATSTREMDRLGGLLKRMPWTGATFLVGSAAICGLPPLNGFIGEFFIYLGSLSHAGNTSVGGAAIAAIVGLSLIGGLAAACFTKVFGIVFLGEPRSEHALRGHEAGPSMLAPMAILAAVCVLIGLCAPLGVGVLARVTASATGLDLEAVRSHIHVAANPLTSITAVCAAFILVIGLLALLRKRLLAGRTVEESTTWDCGYARPAASMQYTSSSFAQPITRMFEVLLRPERHEEKIEKLFPTYASLSTQTGDVFRLRLYRPIFLGVERLFSRLRCFQEGRVQFYILYLALTILILLIWNLI